MAREFLGSLAFVTGGGGGIGGQICRDLAEEGASVVVATRSKAALDLAATLPAGDGRSHLGLRVDVSKKAEVESALAQIIQMYGRPPDLIVNTAGIFGSFAPVEKIKEEDYEKVMGINFKGTFLVTQAFGRALIEAKKPGAIVNLSSILAYKSFPHASIYCASKAAIMQFTKNAAKEWSVKGIRVISVNPGLVDTAMTNHYKDSFLWKDYVQKTSLKRAGVPKDVSDVVLFALSDRSALMTGTHIEVSGQGFW